MKKLALLVAAAVLSGCVTLQSPRVSLADLRILDLTLFEQSYALQIRVQNPNAVALPITGMNFRLDINDVELGRGVSNRAVTVPAYGEAVVEIKLVSNIARVFDQLRAIEKGGAQNLRYRLTGDVRVADRFGTLPFDYRGAVSLRP